MALPIEDEALEQIGPAQEGRIGGVFAAEHHVITAPEPRRARRS